MVYARVYQVSIWAALPIGGVRYVWVGAAGMGGEGGCESHMHRGMLQSAGLSQEFSHASTQHAASRPWGAKSLLVLQLHLGHCPVWSYACLRVMRSLSHVSEEDQCVVCSIFNLWFMDLWYSTWTVITQWHYSSEYFLPNSAVDYKNIGNITSCIKWLLNFVFVLWWTMEEMAFLTRITQHLLQVSF